MWPLAQSIKITFRNLPKETLKIKNNTMNSNVHQHTDYNMDKLET